MSYPTLPTVARDKKSKTRRYQTWRFAAFVTNACFNQEEILVTTLLFHWEKYRRNINDAVAVLAVILLAVLAVLGCSPLIPTLSHTAQRIQPHRKHPNQHWDSALGRNWMPSSSDANHGLTSSCPTPQNIATLSLHVIATRWCPSKTNCNRTCEKI